MMRKHDSCRLRSILVDGTAMLFGLCFVGVIAFSACGNDMDQQQPESDSPEEYRPGDNQGMVPADPIPEPSSIDVRLDEFEIRVPTLLKPGSHLMRVTNDGSEPHGLTVSGNGMDLQLPTSVQPGETQTLPIDLAPGTYRVFCPVDGHVDRGMSVDVTVSE